MSKNNTSPNIFKESLNGLRFTRTLSACAMLLAVQVLLDYIGSFTLGPAIRISFGFLAVAMTAHLFGPVPAMANAALCDIILCILKPIGPYHPGFTLSAALSGLIYGLFFYRRQITAGRVALAKLLVDLCINLLLNTLWLYQIQGKAFMVLMPPRAIKNMLQLPLDVALLMLVLPTLDRVFRRLGREVPAPREPGAKRRGRRWVIAITAILWIVAAVWLNNTSVLVGTQGASHKLLAHRGLAQTFDVKAAEWDTNTAEIIYPPEHEYLENTIASMRRAFELGADVVELDVHRTKDDQLAVFHDYLVDYRTEAKSAVSDFTMDELRRLDVGYGYTADGGQTYPFRGKGVGLMPELREALDAFSDKELLIHVKDSDERAAELIWLDIRDFEPERMDRLQFYGDDASMECLKRQSDRLRVMSMESLKRGLIEYMALGWSGYVPESLKRTEIHLPLSYARLMWGWPAKFVQRMEGAGTRVVLVISDGGYSEGFDDIVSLDEVPANYTGYLWTNRIDRLATARG